MQALSRGSPDAVLRCRCKVILGLVQGKSPTIIAAGGLCSASQVYRVAHRFLGQGLAGLADRREDNGEHKVTERLFRKMVFGEGEACRASLDMIPGGRSSC